MFPRFSCREVTRGLMVVLCSLVLVAGCSEQSETAETSSSSAEAEKTVKLFQEGEHFASFEAPQAPVANRMVEVFWYGCGHCRDFAPIYKKWLDANPDISSRYVPVIWNDKTRLHAKAFYLIQEQENFAELHANMFAAMETIAAEPNIGKQKIALVKKLVEWGIEGERVVDAFESNKYDPAIKEASALMARFGVSSVPSLLVDEQYRVINDKLTSYDEMLAVAEQLLALKPAATASE